MTLPRVLILAWLGCCALATADYAPVWESEPSLWAHAVKEAPSMPRALINRGKMLIAGGQKERGVNVALQGYNEERRRQDAAFAARAARR